MVPFERVLIVGLGLIGGSTALALRRAGFEGEIVAYDMAPAAKQALTAGTVDALHDRALEAGGARAGDLVVLATPVGATVEILRGPARHLAAGVVVTDVGSTKRAVCAAWDEQPAQPGVDFVGGHPMCGSHRSGFAAAREDLFDGATYFLVADHGTARDDMTAVVEALGARPVVVDAGTHDRAVAMSSHLPQLLASVLGAVVADSDLPVVRASGLASMTRLAASPWSVWSDTFATNHDVLAEPLDQVIALLAEARSALAVGDPAPLERLFARAASFENLPLHALDRDGPSG